MRARAVLLLAVALACGSPRPARMYPAGSDKDDGYGDLARMSAHLRIGGGSDAPPFAAHHRHRPRTASDAYGGDAYGGASYGGDLDPNADVIAPSPRYTPATGLTGAIEGTVTWRGGAPAAPLTTACGAIATPSVRLSAQRGVAGVLVYIDHVDVGRTLPALGRPAGVGGIITKRGCALGPPLQIITPLPADLVIHGDATGARLRVTLPGGPRPVELQPAGRILLAAQPGVTRIEADDDSLAAAWVIGSNTPYYALTDDRGRFRIDELAAGTYELTFFHPPVPTAAHGKIVYGAPVVEHRSVKVEAHRPAHLDIALP